MSKYFWEQQDWLDKVKNTNMDFYNHIKNGKNIEMDWNSFSLIIDGVNKFILNRYILILIINFFIN